jgi:hypothetical protein
LWGGKAYLGHRVVAAVWRFKDEQIVWLAGMEIGFACNDRPHLAWGNETLLASHELDLYATWSMAGGGNLDDFLDALLPKILGCISYLIPRVLGAYAVLAQW